ncbi:MAG: TIM barrel protein [Acidimicrobiia bacterium]|nr:TIM barrel protein [Acidimicrobiia bacterium]
MPRLAANLSLLFGELAPLDRPAAAAAAGFGGVEWQFPYDLDAGALAESVAGAGVEAVLVNTPRGPGDEAGLAAVPGRADEFRAGLERARALAQGLGCPRVHVLAGVARGPEAVAAYVENLRWAADRLAEGGVTVCIEPLNQRDFPGYLLSGTTQALEVIDAVGRPNVTLQFDTYHLQILEGDLTTRLRSALALVGHVQVAGVPDRHEPDQGEVDHRWLLAELDAAGYGGWVGCEYRPAGGTLEGLGWAAPYGIAAPGSARGAD